MSLSRRQVRVALALGALGYRYLDLVSTRDDQVAVVVRQAFVRLYNAEGYQALTTAGVPALPRTLNPARGWHAAFKNALLATVLFFFRGSSEVIRVFATMPDTLEAVRVWWAAEARPQVTPKLTTAALEILMELEYTPLDAASIDATIAAYLADPVPIVDNWVDVQPAPEPPSQSSPTPTSTTPVTAEVVNARRSAANVIQLPGSTVRARSGSAPSWPVLVGAAAVLAGVGYGAWLVLKEARG